MRIRPSALDVAGAAVALPLAVLFWIAFFDGLQSDAPSTLGLWVVLGFAAVMSFVSVYCIARLLGVGR